MPFRPRVDGSLEFRSEAPLGPFSRDPSEYVTKHRVTLKALVESDEGDLGEVKAGRLTVLQIHDVAALNNRVPVREVCDCHSDALYSLFTELFDAKGELKDGLDFEPGYSGIIIVANARIEDAYKDTKLLAQAIESVATMLCPQGLIVVPKSVALQLSPEEIEGLGLQDMRPVHIHDSQPWIYIRDNNCVAPGIGD
jgi:hypothetical protein